MTQQAVTSVNLATTMRFARSNFPIAFGASLLAVILAISIVGPHLYSIDPNMVSPLNRLKLPSSVHFFGTDALGRDLFSRVMYGGRISLIVGVSVAVLSMIAGITLGLVAGYFSSVDAILSRVLEAFMAIPAVLLAIALIALTKASVGNVPSRG